MEEINSKSERYEQLNLKLKSEKNDRGIRFDSRGNQMITEGNHFIDILHFFKSNFA